MVTWIMFSPAVRVAAASTGGLGGDNRCFNVNWNRWNARGESQNGGGMGLCWWQFTAGYTLQTFVYTFGNEAEWPGECQPEPFLTSLIDQLPIFDKLRSDSFQRARVVVFGPFCFLLTCGLRCECFLLSYRRSDRFCGTSASCFFFSYHRNEGSK